MSALEQVTQDKSQSMEKSLAPIASVSVPAREFREFTSPDSVKYILSQGKAFIGKHITRVVTLGRYKGQGKRMFGSVCDGSESIGLQFMYEFPTEIPDHIVKFVDEANVGSSILITGVITESPASGQEIELAFESGVVISSVRTPDTYQYGPSMHKRPKQGRDQTLEDHQKQISEGWQTRLTMIRSDPHGRFRDKVIQCVTRMRGRAKTSLYMFFDLHDFVPVDTALITESDCEGAGEMFRVSALDPKDLPLTDAGTVDYSKDFFAKQANLTVSGQLDAEAAAQGLGKVFTFGPTFRAENSHTHRHLAEFWMLEPELVFTEGDVEERFSRLLDLEESMIKYVVQTILTRSSGDLTCLSQTTSPRIVEFLTTLVTESFGRITYTEAIDLLTTAVGKGRVFEESNIIWGMDLASEHERYLCEEVFKKPIFVTHYPQDLKSFYMKADEGCEEGRQTCQAVDLLVPGIGELCGGSMREDDPEKLEKVMKKKGVPIAELQWYIDLRKDGGFSTGGFGIGFERLVRLLTGMKSVRDVIAYPRYPGHL